MDSCSNKNRVSDLEMFVLDVLRYDIEQISSIMKLLNSRIGWRSTQLRDFEVDEVKDAITSLIKRGLVTPYSYNLEESKLELLNLVAVDSGDLDSLWFALNNAGRQLWERWEPPDTEPQNELNS